MSGTCDLGFPSARSCGFLLIGALIYAVTSACQSGSENSSRSQQVDDPNSTGVEICDSYLEQYQACILPRLPPSQTERHLTGIQRQRDAWRNLAETPAKRESLARICRAAIETARQEFSGCTFTTG